MAQLYNIVEQNRASTQSGLALGAQMAQNSIRMQQLRSERALQQLRERQAAEALRIATFQHDQLIEEQAHNAKASARFQSLITPTLQMPTEGGTTAVPNPAFTPDIGRAYMESFLPGSSDPGKVLLNAATLQLRQTQAAQAQREANFQPTMTPMVDPTTGQKRTVFRGAPGSATLVGSGAVPDKLEIAQEMSRLQTLIANSTGPERQQAVQALENIQAQMAASTTEVFDPATGNPIMRTTTGRQPAAAGATTVATRTALEKQEAEVRKAFGLGQQISNLLTPGNVGLAGAGQRAFESIATQLDPNFKISGATDAKTLGKIYSSSLIKAMKSDSNIAEPERRDLQGAFEIIDWRKGLPQAKATLATTLEQWGRLSRNNAELQGKPVLSVWLTPDEVFGMLQQGKVSAADADLLMQDNGWNLVNSLRESALRNPSPASFSTTPRLRPQ